MLVQGGPLWETVVVNDVASMLSCSSQPTDGKKLLLAVSEFHLVLVEKCLCLNGPRNYAVGGNCSQKGLPLQIGP